MASRQKISQMKPALFILAGNGPYDNRGCEAIVRGTVEILRAQFERPKFIVCSQFTSGGQFKRQQNGESDPDIQHVAMQRFPQWPGIWNKVLWAGLIRLPRFRREHTYRAILGEIQKADAVLSVGGDNYSLEYPGSLVHFTDLDEVALDRHKPIVIWGASVGPFSANPTIEHQLAAHLKRLTGIFARETKTVEYLAGIGIHDLVHLVADPAFVMAPSEPMDGKRFQGLARSVGINFSPLMARFVCGGDRQEWICRCAAILRKVRASLDRPILLIPHVFDERQEENDLVFLREVMTQVSSDPLIRLLDQPYSAAELKWFVSKCFIFAGARTHSTIAAFSSNVPTLSFSYSQKSIGLNIDLYGHLSFCLGPSQLSEESVAESLLRLARDESQIRENLRLRNQKMREAAFSAGLALKKIMGYS